MEPWCLKLPQATEYSCLAVAFNTEGSTIAVAPPALSVRSTNERGRMEHQINIECPDEVFSAHLPRPGSWNPSY